MNGIMGECFGDLEDADSFMGALQTDSNFMGAGPDVAGIISSLANAIPGVISSARGEAPQQPKPPKDMGTKPEGTILGVSYLTAGLVAAGAVIAGSIILKRKRRRR